MTSTPEILIKKRINFLCFFESYPLHERYGLDEVRPLVMNNGKQGAIIKAYRLPDEDGNITEEAPVYFIDIVDQPYWFLQKGPTCKYYEYLKKFYDDIKEKFTRATPVDNNML